MYRGALLVKKQKRGYLYFVLQTSGLEINPNPKVGIKMWFHQLCDYAINVIPA